MQVEKIYFKEKLAAFTELTESEIEKKGKDIGRIAANKDMERNGQKVSESV